MWTVYFAMLGITILFCLSYTLFSIWKDKKIDHYRKLAKVANNEKMIAKMHVGLAKRQVQHLESSNQQIATDMALLRKENDELQRDLHLVCQREMGKQREAVLAQREVRELTRSLESVRSENNDLHDTILDKDTAFALLEAIKDKHAQKHAEAEQALMETRQALVDSEALHKQTVKKWSAQAAEDGQKVLDHLTTICTLETKLKKVAELCKAAPEQALRAMQAKNQQWLQDAGLHF